MGGGGGGGGANGGPSAPTATAAAAVAAAGQQFRLEGITRRGETPSRFTPANVAAAGSWFYLDPPGVAAALSAAGPTATVRASVAATTTTTAAGGTDTAGRGDAVGGDGREGARTAGRCGSGDGGGGDDPLWVVEVVDENGAAAAAGTYPRPRGLAELAAFPTTVETHAIYAATWGGLATMLGVLTRGRFRGRPWAWRA
ncbi:hypothetical protein MMPV_003435 [Pyropia vietnamensis]